MNNPEARYRLRLAEGFLKEARQDVDLKRWRSALDNGQLAVEHAAKAVRALTEKAELLRPDVHIQTDYGDEVGGRTPWELFDEEDARQALQIAEEALALARQIIGGG